MNVAVLGRGWMQTLAVTDTGRGAVHDFGISVGARGSTARDERVGRDDTWPTILTGYRPAAFSYGLAFRFDNNCPLDNCRPGMSEPRARHGDLGHKVGFSLSSLPYSPIIDDFAFHVRPTDIPTSLRAMRRTDEIRPKRTKNCRIAGPE